MGFSFTLLKNPVSCQQEMPQFNHDGLDYTGDKKKRRTAKIMEEKNKETRMRYELASYAAFALWHLGRSCKSQNLISPQVCTLRNVWPGHALILAHNHHLDCNLVYHIHYFIAHKLHQLNPRHSSKELCSIQATMVP